MAIGCGDVEKEADFFTACCLPRKVGKELDDKYPAACNLDAYLVFDPEYKKDVTVAKLGSLQEYQGKIGYDQSNVAAPLANEDTQAVTGKKAGAAQKADVNANEAAPASVSTTASSSSSSSSSTWSSSSSEVKTPEAAPQWTSSSSSSSASETWTPQANTWTPEASSSSSANGVWNGDNGRAAAAWTPSSSSQWVAPAAPTPANNGGGASFHGTASWFTQNGNAGACGIYHSDNDYIVAISASMASAAAASERWSMADSVFGL